MGMLYSGARELFEYALSPQKRVICEVLFYNISNVREIMKNLGMIKISININQSRQK